MVDDGVSKLSDREIAEETLRILRRTEKELLPVEAASRLILTQGDEAEIRQVPLDGVVVGSSVALSVWAIDAKGTGFPVPVMPVVTSTNPAVAATVGASAAADGSWPVTVAVAQSAKAGSRCILTAEAEGLASNAVPFPILEKEPAEPAKE